MRGPVGGVRYWRKFGLSAVVARVLVGAALLAGLAWLVGGLRAPGFASGAQTFFRAYQTFQQEDTPPPVPPAAPTLDELLDAPVPELRRPGATLRMYVVEMRECQRRYRGEAEQRRCMEARGWR